MTIERPPQAIVSEPTQTSRTFFLSQKPSATEKKSGSFSFLDFFKKGSAGREVFSAVIVPFLNLDDLIHGSATCREMNAMCRTYTVGDVLSMHSMDHIGRQHKIEVGKLIIATVSPQYNSKLIPARRLIRMHTESFSARLYHPSVIEEILLAMAAYFYREGIEFDSGMDDFDWDANIDSTLPLLVSARYGYSQGQFVDATFILRYLLLKQGNTRLVLQCRGERWWYNCLFGDPFMGKTKALAITVQLRDGAIQTHWFPENTTVKMELRAGPLGAVPLFASFIELREDHGLGRLILEDDSD